MIVKYLAFKRFRWPYPNDALLTPSALVANRHPDPETTVDIDKVLKLMDKVPGVELRANHRLAAKLPAQANLTKIWNRTRLAKGKTQQASPQRGTMLAVFLGGRVHVQRHLKIISIQRTIHVRKARRTRPLQGNMNRQRRLAKTVKPTKTTPHRQTRQFFISRCHHSPPMLSFQ